MGATEGVMIVSISLLVSKYSPPPQKGRPMPTAEKTATPPKQTWVDLMPPGAPMPELLSHDELLAALRDRGVGISPYTLEHYRRNGVLPRPIRHQHAGAVRPVYPLWFLDAITYVKKQQGAGMSLSEIKPRVTEWMRTWAVSHILWDDPVPTAALDVVLREYAKAAQPWIIDRGTINSIRVALLDADGKELDYHNVPYSPD